MTKLVFFLLAAFLFFVPLGSTPIWIGVVKLDNAIGILFCLVLVSYLAIHLVYTTYNYEIVLGTFFFYFFVLFCSAILSSNLFYSLSRYVIILGYGITALVIPLVFARDAKKVCMLGRLVFVFSVFSSLIIIAAYFLLGMSNWGRMTIPVWSEGSFQYFPNGWGSSADPNVLAIGLVISLAFGISVGRIKNRYIILFSPIVAAAIILTFSRTAILFSITAFFMTGAIIYGPRFLITGRVGGVSYTKLCKYFIVTLLIIGVGIYFLPLEILIERFSEGGGERLIIYQAVLENWWGGVKEVFFGVGFNTARLSQDPHNIYLTALHDSGILGLVALVMFLSSVLVLLFNIKLTNKKFSALFMFVFILMCGATYWQTKTLWVTIMFVLLIQQNAAYNIGPRKIIRSSDDLGSHCA